VLQYIVAYLDVRVRLANNGDYNVDHHQNHHCKERIVPDACVCVIVCLCERERERGREIEQERECVCVRVCNLNHH